MENNNQENLLKEFTWEAPEFEKTEKNKSWFIFPAIIVIILGIIALITDNILFLILILLAFLTFYLYAKKEPRIIKFKVNERGIEVDNRLYAFDSIRSFWIFYNPPMEKEISFRSRKSFSPYIKISLADQNPNEIRKYLLRFLPEKRHKVSLIDIWMRRIGF
ncbi:MAG TPA: hypothetical protein VMW82_00695 [Candidatus Paceibacterota bacterium]|nr:hypothetical protein [Candidatus Paceibacterota bacterium]